MREPERREPADISSPGERSRVVRAAALRPINVLMVVIGMGIFATTLAAWIPPLTLLTYALLVFLSARDPDFRQRVLRGGNDAARSLAPAEQDISPERRARWLARGETRERVEAALVIYRKVVSAIEESDEVTHAVLDDAIPKLHAAANRLVDVAHGKERAAETISDLRQDTGTGGSNAREHDLKRLEAFVRAADQEISETFDKLLTLRARVVRVSIEGGASDQAAAFTNSLDELNVRLEALNDTMSPPTSER